MTNRRDTDAPKPAPTVADTVRRAMALMERLPSDVDRARVLEALDVIAALLAAAIEYADATENNGDPLAAGARLRLAAKAYAVAARDAGEVP